jgi:hypothetical protein
MRRVAGLQTCCTLLLAFLLAPFQHVHTGNAADDHDHHGSELIHAHFHGFPASHKDHHHGQELEDPDDDHAAAWSLDTFTIELLAGLAPFVPARGLVLRFVPPVTFEPVEVVEECGHDPPYVHNFIPRAPPS